MQMSRGQSLETARDIDRTMGQQADVGPKDMSFDRRLDVSMPQNEIRSSETYSPDARADGLYTTYKERIDRVPASDNETVKWEGEKGESLCIPRSDTQAGRDLASELRKFNVDGIEYRNGIPDFSPVALESVGIKNLTDNRYKNFNQARDAVARKWNAEKREGRTDWTRDDVEKWQDENDLVIHECSDLRTCQFVPRDIHGNYSHTGGVCEYKEKKKIIANGGGFDE